MNLVVGQQSASYFTDSGLEQLSHIHIIDAKTLSAAKVDDKRPWRFMPNLDKTKLSECIGTVFGAGKNPLSILRPQDACLIFDGRSQRCHQEITKLLKKAVKHVDKAGAMRFSGPKFGPNPENPD